MCLAVPMKIVELKGDTALVERDGIRRTARVNFLKDPKPGEYVMIHAGFAIERLTEEQAEEDLAAFRELQQAIAGL